MNKWTYFKSLLKLIFSVKKKWKLETGHTVDVAFWCNGKPYYQLKDMFNTFTERGLEAYQVYEEISMRLDVDFLDLFIDKFEQDLNSGKLMDCATTLSFLKERRKFVIPPKELIWKMAAVAYFDENESPYTYDHVHAQEKIKFWKEHKTEIDDFFLYQQLKVLIPLPEYSKEIYHLLQGTIQKIQDYQLQNISGLKSGTYEGNTTSKERKSEAVSG